MLITLDVIENTVDEAIKRDVDLIIAHHPLLFKPLTSLDIDSSKGRIINKLIHHDISVYASHTNLDIASGGVNDMLAEALGLNATEVLIKTQKQLLYKVVVFVPKTHVDIVRHALSDAGAGHIGNYSHCTFQSKGQGTFKPLEGTNPYIGSTNKIEKVDEVKIETIISEDKLTSVVDAMIQAHPYEEVAYDVYLLNQSKDFLGLGRIGSLDKRMHLKDFCKTVKKAFNINHLRVIGDLSREVQRVALIGGSGEKYINEVKQKGADVYITGDVTFHTAQDADAMGLSIIDPGHYIEEIMINHTRIYLQEYFNNQDIKIIESEINTDPFQFV